MLSPTLRRTGLVVTLLGLVVVLAGIGIVVDLAWTWVRHRQPITALRDAPPEQTAFMALRAEQGRAPLLRRWTPLDSLPVQAVCAVVAAEDPAFFNHRWFDWATQRRLLDRLLQGDFSRGGSGIAQQLARNLYLSPERTPRRKAREYILAIQIAEALTKERQLELYLNLVEWGEQAWGIGAGSQQLYGRPPGTLTVSETVVLAAMLPGPDRGPEFPLRPDRFSALLRQVNNLWREGWLDQPDRAAAIARLDRLGRHLEDGLSLAAARAAVVRELGPEAPPRPAFRLPDQSWADLCDASYRGAW